MGNRVYNHKTLISIHALREEGDQQWTFPHWGICDFYPRPPRGGRLSQVCKHRVVIGISIHALREEGDKPLTPARCWTQISIHALREEGDLLRRFRAAQHVGISIHALREEGDM